MRFPPQLREMVDGLNSYEGPLKMTLRQQDAWAVSFALKGHQVMLQDPERLTVATDKAVLSLRLDQLADVSRLEDHAYRLRLRDGQTFLDVYPDAYPDPFSNLYEAQSQTR